MGIIAVTGSLLSCSEGEIPVAFETQASSPILIDGLAIGQIVDNIPGANIGMFGICRRLSEESLFPVPCSYMPASIWIPGDPTVIIGGVPVLSAPNQLICAVGGVINLDFTGQTTIISV